MQIIVCSLQSIARNQTALPCQAPAKVSIAMGDADVLNAIDMTTGHEHVLVESTGAKQSTLRATVTIRV